MAEFRDSMVMFFAARARGHMLLDFVIGTRACLQLICLVEAVVAVSELWASEFWVLELWGTRLDDRALGARALGAGALDARALGARALNARALDARVLDARALGDRASVIRNHLYARKNSVETRIRQCQKM